MMNFFKFSIFTSVILAAITFAGLCLATEIMPKINQDVQQDETVSSSDLDVSEPKLLPDSKFYFLKNWLKGLQSVFTFGQINKANLNLKISSEKLLEMQRLAEKTKNPQILGKAAELYNRQVEKIEQNIAKFKGTATTSQAISKFLDKYTQQQILHEKILESLESKVPTSTMEKIKANRQRHLEKFGEVMQKLEDKTRIKTRLQSAIDAIRGSELKDIKNLSILQKIQNAFPTSTKEQIQQLIEDGLQKIREKLQVMPLDKQEKLQNYLENIQATLEEKLKIINKLQNLLPSTTTIRQKLSDLKEKLQNSTSTRRWGQECVCIELYNPVCGADGKTYGNPCKAQCQNIAVVSQGPCGGKATSTQNIVGGDKDEHGCIGSAGYSWCEAKQKCLRIWEENCPTTTSATQ